MNNLSSALQSQTEILNRIDTQTLTVFLDYDGTLTPIVDRPDLAILSPKMKAVIKDLSQQCLVAIISGRGREDIEKLISLPDLYYAGSHGFDIKGPQLTMVPQDVLPILPLIEKTYSELVEKTKGITGSLIENKKFALAIHFRLVDKAEVPQIERIVDEIAAREPQLQKTTGKMIFELRANIPWDKGKAVLYLLKALDINGATAFPIYIGDDDTDEDAFTAIKGRGLGILVTDSPRESAADYTLQDTQETENFLTKLSNWLRVKTNE